MESKNTVRNRNTTNDRAIVLQLFTTKNKRAKYILFNQINKYGRTNRKSTTGFR